MDRPEERLALIEVVEREGQPARLVDVQAWPVSIGRALNNTVVLDDPQVAAQHARLDIDAEGLVALTVLASRNGVQLDGKTLSAGEPMTLPPHGARWRMGRTRLRLRLPAEALAPERPLQAGRAPGDAGLLAVGAALLATEFGEHVLRLDPGADFSAWLPKLVGVPAVVAIWCAIWALLSKLFQHHFDFIGHLRIALPWSLLIAVVSALCPLLGASLGSPTLWRLSAPLEALGAAMMIHVHLQHVLPARPRAVAWVVASVSLLAAGALLARNWRSSDSWSGAPYMSTLPLPALRLAGTSPPEQLLAAMKPLTERLAARARQARQDDREDGREGGDANEE